jgi:hypothetical protein
MKLDLLLKNIDYIPSQVVTQRFRIPEQIVFTDASDFACGGVFIDTKGEFFSYYVG